MPDTGPWAKLFRSTKQPGSALWDKVPDFMQLFVQVAENVQQKHSQGYCSSGVVHIPGAQ